MSDRIATAIRDLGLNVRVTKSECDIHITTYEIAGGPIRQIEVDTVETSHEDWVDVVCTVPDSRVPTDMRWFAQVRSTRKKWVPLLGKIKSIRWKLGGIRRYEASGRPSQEDISGYVAAYLGSHVEVTKHLLAGGSDVGVTLKEGGWSLSPGDQIPFERVVSGINESNRDLYMTLAEALLSMPLPPDVVA